MWPARGQYVKVGKGSLFLADVDDDGNELPLDFVGECDSVSIGSEANNIQIRSHTEQSGALIDETTLSTDYTFTANAKEFTIENLRRWMKGEEVVRTQAASTGRQGVFENVVRGKWYDLGARNITEVALTQGTETLVEGTDYVLKAGHGLLQIRPGAPHVADGDDVNYSLEQPEIDFRRIRMNRKASPRARLLFLGDDSNTQARGAKDRVEVWRVNVSPDGELNLVGDDYGGFGVRMTIVDDSANHPTEPYGYIERFGDDITL